jgi:predicted dehydrogenase
MKELKSAIIGAGLMGDRHAKACSQYSNVKLVAVCDINEEKANELANNYGEKIEVYADYKDMLNKSDADIIHIATPDFAHAEPLLASIEANKHVIVEKPLVTNSDDFKKVKSSINKNKNKVFINFSQRWNPVYQKVKMAISNAELGQIQHGYAKVSNTIDIPLEMLKEWAHKSSPTEFLLTHYIDLMRWFLEDEVEEVYAYITEGVLKSKGVYTHDSVNVISRFKKGAVICFESSWILPKSYPTYGDYCTELVGSKGAILTDGNDECIKKYYAKVEHPRTFNMDTIDQRGIGFFFESIYNFFDAILGIRKPISNYQDGLKNVEIIMAILLSAKEHKIVKFPLF